MGATGSRIPLRYIGADEVDRLLPELPERLNLVRETFESLAEGTSEASPALHLHPRPTGFADAMPAYSPSRDLTSIKWIAADERNGERGLPYISGLIILNDSDSGIPLAVIDAGAITAARTAAVSGVSIDALAPAGWSAVGIVGFGVQARAHVEMLRELNPAVSIRATRRGVAPAAVENVEFVESAREAVQGADIVITAIPLSSRLDPQVQVSDLGDGTLVLPLDDDAAISAELITAAALFAVDDPIRYARDQDQGLFEGWPAPAMSVAEAVFGRSRPQGLCVCMSQGMGMMDAPLADVVRRAAEQQGIGQLLAR